MFFEKLNILTSKSIFLPLKVGLKPKFAIPLSFFFYFFQFDF